MDYSLFDKLLSPLLLINGDFDVLFLNRAAREAYSYNPEKSAAASKCFRISHGYNSPCYEHGEHCPVKELMEEGGKNISAVNHLHKDGYYKVEVYRDDKNKLHFFEFYTKISEFEYKSAALKKEIEDMAVFKDLFYNNSYVMWIFDPETLKIIDINEAAVKFYGYAKEEIIGKTIYNTINPLVTKEIINENINMVLSGGQSIFYGFKHRLKNGVFKDVQISLTIVYIKNIRYVLAMVLDITELIGLRKQLELEKELYKNLSIEDALTGIFNRRKFESSLEDSMKLAFRYKRPLSLVMFDIDRFKEINDTFGHQAGDSVLCELTGLVKTALRDTDIIARYGGEEFMVIMPETDIGDAKDIAERIRKTVENRIFKYVPSVTISLGVGRYADGEAPDGFIKRADDAMYKAKKSGRNRVC